MRSEPILIASQTFTGADLRESGPLKGEYENCTFTDCDFSNSDLSEFIFDGCTFFRSNLSLAKLKRTALRDITFSECKMVGLHFEDCDQIGISFDFQGCILNNSSFFGMKIKKVIFRKSSLQEADFTDSDISGSLLDGCDMLNATFSGTNLEKADLSTSFNYSIDPTSNKIKKAKFSQSGLSGLLDVFGIEIV
ncbi:MAG: hypothetical protein CVT93_03285 [Bacteroidetes bacterium HGW-Bacteroidetes-10]|nr:MAG: hypothetical protein CVT93_03285 [Bacteroidetes bacterium HGW-Bacteroidetes-10]